MPIEFRCDKCQTLLRTPDEAAGREAICPQCGQKMLVPYVSRPGPRSPYVVPEEDEPESTVLPAPGESAATASLLLGLTSLLFSFCWLMGLPASIIGLVSGILGLRSQYRTMAIAGIVLCALGLIVNLGLVTVRLFVGGWGFHWPAP